MKLSKLALIAAVACGINAANLSGVHANELDLVSCSQPSCDCGEPVCGCETVGGCFVDPTCGAETSCCEDTTCCDSGCDSACGCGAGGCLPGINADCCLGDPLSLFGDIGHGISVGGWASVGYHSAALPLFNSRPDEVQLHQAWLYAEKAIDTSNGFDIGGRFDYIYGTDGPDTQAFGIDDDHWDNDWDNGGDYGSAIPQLYVEAGYGDLTVKAGHFFTIIGWEVVAAPDNFFYSHAYTMYNSEPFTHTGALATYNATDDVTMYGGYVMGWDSGFEDNGDAFLGGTSLGLTDDLTLTYATIFGRFDDGDAGIENGYMHSIVADYAVSDKLQYIFQTDLLDTEDEAGNTVRSTFGINQYLIYSVNDCLAFGTRFEWWNVGGDSAGFVDLTALDLADPAQAAIAANYNADDDFNVFALTFGANYKPHSNVIMRPEVRWDWVDGNTDALAAVDGPSLEDGDDSQFTFGMDTIFLF